MAPVEPTELLKAFKPLLTIAGGIKSIGDVPRLSQLMRRYSKKLVSRCIYCNILLATAPDVLQSFLDIDGWNLINVWLKESINANNIHFTRELLDLLFKCPMTVDRLKQNDTPKMVKGLTKNSDKEVATKAKSMVSKWTEIIKPNENVNGTQATVKKKKKKEKAADEERDPVKTQKVKGTTVVAPISVNDTTVISTSSDTTSKPLVKGTEGESGSNDGVNNNKTDNRPRTAKVAFGKSRSLGLLEDSSDATVKTKGAGKKGDEANSTCDKSGAVKINLNNKTPDTSVPNSGQSKSGGNTKSKPVLKESIGFIEDIVSLSSGPVKKRRKSDSKSKSTPTPSSSSAKDSGSMDSPNNGGEEPMDTQEEGSDEMEEDRVTPASGEDSNSNPSNNVNSYESDKLPVVDVPELENLVIPEVEPSKLSGVIKSILNYGNKPGKAKKSVKWRPEDKIKEIKYFEVDKTERANVFKTNFSDFRSNDIKNERQMLQQLRNKGNPNATPVPGVPGIPGLPGVAANPSVDKCISYHPWRLVKIDLPEGLPLVVPGCQSEEKLQSESGQARQSLTNDFFPIKLGHHESNPKEPDVSEPSSVPIEGPPLQIPLDDENGNLIDYSALPRPEPRNDPPRAAPPNVMPGSFQQPALPPRLPGLPPRAPFAGPNFVPPAAGYPPYPPVPIPPSGVGPYPPISCGAARLVTPRPMPPGMHHPGFQPPGAAGGWSQRPRTPPVCRNFMRTGSCRFMARCNYLHQYPSNPHGSGPGPSAPRPPHLD